MDCLCVYVSYHSEMKSHKLLHNYISLMNLTVNTTEKKNNTISTTYNILLSVNPRISFIAKMSQINHKMYHVLNEFFFFLSVPSNTKLFHWSAQHFIEEPYYQQVTL